MEQPEGFIKDPNKCCKLIKSQYGFKQAPEAWNDCFVALTAESSTSISSTVDEFKLDHHPTSRPSADAFATSIVTTPIDALIRLALDESNLLHCPGSLTTAETAESAGASASAIVMAKIDLLMRSTTEESRLWHCPGFLTSVEKAELTKLSPTANIDINSARTRSGSTTKESNFEPGLETPTSVGTAQFTQILPTGCYTF